MVQSPPPAFRDYERWPLLGWGKRSATIGKNRKLQIVPNLSLGPTGTKSQEPKLYSRSPPRSTGSTGSTAWAHPGESI
ncbi:hypothetical protein F5Y13DRAFT_151821 [Hypoxylon sp. FL1857]|nr:hypothetical protein F5Y13DRAFT_151821 [Hypoxylon sp. FL1857]